MDEMSRPGSEAGLLGEGCRVRVEAVVPLTQPCLSFVRGEFDSSDCLLSGESSTRQIVFCQGRVRIVRLSFVRGEFDTSDCLLSGESSTRQIVF
ncbi:hypothetical protein ACOMHN_014384 [Nucella lapillus]